MNKTEIASKLSCLDGRGSDREYDAVKSLSSLGERFSELLLEKYRCSRKWGERSSCVYHAIKLAISDEAAYQLGMEALRDKSKHVRYRACMLLAVAQNKKALGELRGLLRNSASSEDAKAAIDAIENHNHHYFIDRNHSGMVTLNV